MGTVVPRVESAPQLYARAAGALYLVVIVLGIFAEAFVRGRLKVSGDAMATAANLRASEQLWRLGILSEVVALVCVIGLTMTYYVLLKPVSRELALLATFLRLIAIALQAVAVGNLVAALFPLGNAAALQAFTQEQLAALVSLAIRAHGQGFGLSLLITGCLFLIHGYLIARSGFLPRVLGLLIQVAGLCYFANSLALLLAPALATRLFPFILLPPFVAEVALCLWLLIKGVDVEKWRQAAARPDSP